MKIKHIHIENFGKLSKVNLDIDDNINSLLRRNSWGKTTLAVFIKVMFYGFSAEGKQDEVENERKHYQPWNMGAYGGSITFSLNNKLYRCERLFGKKKNGSEDRFALFDAKTNLITEDYTSNLGEEIFHLDMNSFMNSMYISQIDKKMYITSNLTENIVDTAATSANLGMSDYALASIKKIKDYLNPQRKTGKLYKLNDELLFLEGEISRKESLIEERKTVKEECENLEEEKNKLLGGFDEEEEVEEKNLPFLKKISKLLPESVQKNFIDALKNDSVRHNIATKKRINFQNIKNILEDLAKMELIVFALIVIIFLIFNQKIFSLTALKIMVITSIVITLAYYIIFRYVIKDYIKWEEELEEEDIEEESDENKQELIENCINEIITKKNKISEIDSKLEIIAEKELEYQKLADKYEVLKWEYEKYLNVEYFIQKARINISKRLLEPLKISFDKYFNILCRYTKAGYTAKDFVLDANLRLHINTMGALRSIDFLSEGYKDLVSLCLRIAVIEAMYENEKPIIILDDSFVNLDDEKMAGAFDFLREISKSYQILYLTCSKTRLL